jgi:xylan 1,4-beta-xylosidase
MKNRTTFKYLIIALLSASHYVEAQAKLRSIDKGTIPVSIKIDYDGKQGELRKIWRFFGCDEPNYAYMPNGTKLLKELGELDPQQVFFRTHNLLNTGDGVPSLKWGSTNAYTEDKNGNPLYDWTITDRIFDTYLQSGVKPYAQIGFMPEALSTHPIPYKHNWDPTQKYNNIFTGWAYPPKDYNKWEELVFQWVKHCVEKYGVEEVEKWYWETWNEPNIGYWKGTRDEFFKLHDYAIQGVLRALPTARVGGPDTAGPGGDFMKAFLDHCLHGTNYATGKTGTPLHFVSFHAKGSPEFKDGHVSMNMSNQLKNIEDGFKMISSYPELKNIPVVIGECDPEGCAACQGERLGYRNGTMYSSYTAASFMRIHELASKYGINIEGALTWAFEFENKPYFAGFRSLASNGLDKPVLNVFRMFSRMKGNKLKVFSNAEIQSEDIIMESVKNSPDISALASTDGEKIYILLWYYHDEDLPGLLADVSIDIFNLPKEKGNLLLHQWLVDKNNGNTYSKWLQFGSPQHPSNEQYKEIEKAGELKALPNKILKIRHGKTSALIRLERQGVMLLIADLN